MIKENINRPVTEAEARLKLLILENKIFTDHRAYNRNRAALIKLARGEMLPVVHKQDRLRATAIVYTDKSAILTEWSSSDPAFDDWASLPNLDDYEVFYEDK